MSRRLRIRNGSSFPFCAKMRFYGELDYFLAEQNRNVEFTYSFKGRPSIKDAIEANQVPHTEIGCITVNGRHVDFTYHLKDGDSVSVYPVLSRESVTSPRPLRPEAFSMFIADVHLGRLARYLRLCGLDVVFDIHLDDAAIIKRAVEEKRIILTRDRKLLHNKVIVHGCCLHSQTPLVQLREVIDRYRLKDSLRPLSRCLICNGKLIEVDKASIIDRLEPKTRIYYEHFRKCEGCGRIFWKGSHFEKLEKILESAEADKTGFDRGED